MAREGSMEHLKGDDKKAAVKGVPGAFGKKDKDTQPNQGDKHSSMQKNEEPVKSGGGAQE